MIKPKVLFLCGANSCRTQMAEGFLRDLAGDRFEVASAGYELAGEICAAAVAAMAEVGIDISGSGRSRWIRLSTSTLRMSLRSAIGRREGDAPFFPASSGASPGRLPIRTGLTHPSNGGGRA